MIPTDLEIAASITCKSGRLYYFNGNGYPSTEVSSANRYVVYLEDIDGFSLIRQSLSATFAFGVFVPSSPFNPVLPWMDQTKASTCQKHGLLHHHGRSVSLLMPLRWDQNRTLKLLISAHCVSWAMLTSQCVWLLWTPPFRFT